MIDLNKRIQQLAEQEGTAFVNYYKAMKNKENGMDVELAEDGAHPTAKGYTIMKDLVLSVIGEVLGD